MLFPAWVKKLNNFLATFSGTMILIIAAFAAMEVFMRKVLMDPTTWSLNLSQYMLIWAILLVSASTFENKGHVSVDFIRVALARRFGRGLAKATAIISYVFCLIYDLVLLWKSSQLFMEAIKTGQLSLGTIQIPTVYLYAAMIIGPIFIAITLVCIIMDLLADGKTYQSEEEF